MDGHWRVRMAPLGYPPCPSGVRTVSRWGAPCPSGVRTVSQWGTHRVPVGYAPCPSGVRTVSQWGTPRPPVGYAPSPSRVRPVPQWGTCRPSVGCAPSPSGHHLCRSARSPVSRRGSPDVATRLPATRSHGEPDHESQRRAHDRSPLTPPPPPFDDISADPDRPEFPEFPGQNFRNRHRSRVSRSLARRAVSRARRYWPANAVNRPN